MNIIFSSSSCEKNTKTEDEKRDPIEIVLSASENKMAVSDKSFALNIFESVCKNDAGKENIMISPFSLSSALAMVWNGADGQTKSAIQNTIGFEGYQEKEVNDYFKKMRESLISTDPSVKLAIANSIWYRTGAKINDVFVKSNKMFYNAQVQALDFSLPSAKNTINNWCSDNTNGLIKDVVKETPPDALIYLLNALYFKGEWKSGYGFDEKNTRNGTFKCDDGKTVSVQMMNNVRKISYFEDQTLSAVTLPYGNGAFNMVILLPKTNISTGKMIDALKNEQYWGNILTKWTTKEVSMQVPKFKFKYEIDLNSILKAMGMAVAFDPLSANFSKAFTDNNFFISLVKQFTYIDVNEKGTEAAAVTVIMGVTSAGPAEHVSFIADHPFVFAIVENSTGCILFMGKVGNPS
ncbi:MAG: serpin family protein [Bacteroidales bacterium]